MANLRISEFTGNSTLNGSEIVLGVQSGNTTKISMDGIKDFVTKLGYMSAPEILISEDDQEIMSVVLHPNSVYTVDCLLLIENGNADGIKFSLDVFALDVTTFGLVYTTSSGATGVMNQVIPTTVADITGESYIRIHGLIQVTATGGTLIVKAAKGADATTDPTIAAASFIRVIN